MADLVTRHCREIERCNQRVGRMLSAVDLIRAGTITEDLAAYALGAIRGGASFMVGARPGGAGKTTVMGALLNFVPADVELAAADGLPAIDAARTQSRRRCYICHEIGAGPYYAYLWGEPLRRYFDLPLAGHMLSTNLHADTYEEARERIGCGGDQPLGNPLAQHLERSAQKADRHQEEVEHRDKEYRANDVGDRLEIPG